jgi:hypothetical protein
VKTLLFAPCYLDGNDRLERNLKWLEYYTKLPSLKFDEILLVDNASSEANKKILKEKFPQVTLIECKVHLGRPRMNQYGYWYSAFGKAAKYALENGFEKIVHIDSDVFLFTDRIVDHVNSYGSGWSAFWCGIHNYPETIFQLIAGREHLAHLYEHMTRDFLSYYPNEMAETHIPFTEINKDFIGDRYPERHIFTQDPSWDYCGQVPVSMKVKWRGSK